MPYRDPIRPPGIIYSGKQTVSPIGTPVKLVSGSTPVQCVYIQSLPTNTSPVCFGSSNVIATSPYRGVFLYKPTVVPSIQKIEIDDLNKVYIDAQVHGEGVTYTFVKQSG